MRGDMRVGLALKEIRETEVELPQLHMVFCLVHKLSLQVHMPMKKLYGRARSIQPDLFICIAQQIVFQVEMTEKV
jgi:hypothetical protein